MSDQILAQLIPAFFATITTIIGGIFGFLLSEMAARRREAREARERSVSVRLIVGLEIDRNLDTLRAFWTQIRPSDETGDRRKLNMTRQFVDIPLLPFSQDALNSQLPLMAQALPRPVIASVFQFYDKLGKIQTLHAELNEANHDQQQEMAKFRASATAPGQPPGIMYAPRTPLDNKSSQLWDEIEQLFTSVLKDGNPISSH